MLGGLPWAGSAAGEFLDEHAATSGAATAWQRPRWRLQSGTVTGSREHRCSPAGAGAGLRDYVKSAPTFKPYLSYHPSVHSSVCRGLLVAQALLQVTAKLAQQANSLSFVNMLWLTAHCVASQTGYYKRKLACFHIQHCPLETCLLMAFACCTAANLAPCWQQIS